MVSVSDKFKCVLVVLSNSFVAQEFEQIGIVFLGSQSGAAVWLPFLDEVD
jgi:hypothetical protein